MTVSWRILEGDCRDRLRDLDAGSVHTCVTSPPYFGLRDYGTAGQIGLEPTPDEFVAAMVQVFRAVRRVLRDDGTVWLNLGDSYAGYHGNSNVGDDPAPSDKPGYWENMRISTANVGGIKQKDLLGIPWQAAFALRADGWYLRSDIIWSKPNPMPESVTDRPTKAHEYLFLLSKGPRYYYDADAIREQGSENTHAGSHSGERSAAHLIADRRLSARSTLNGNENRCTGANKRSVWTVATQPYAGAHFATFPPKLIEPCILAGAPEGGTVLDPFAGAGTTGLVALKHGRSFTGIELSLGYADMARRRIIDDAPLLNGYAAELEPEPAIVVGQLDLFAEAS